ncbi:hypothetical protein ACSQ67_016048 [Phaseolus vulgaris]
MGGGGGDHGHGNADFRTKVWSMTGGPHCRPKHWKRNTAIAMLGVVLVCIPIAMKSAELERCKNGGEISAEYPYANISSQHFDSSIFWLGSDS